MSEALGWKMAAKRLFTCPLPFPSGFAAAWVWGERMITLR
ncbi:hypothetical protein CA13_27080 [Planctomycetes bacterium CA13]|uniref:Uncharacterized protein n=1 Tax=Novipirellula herctigrandis TaxID=2527986 RepID=A0A5C5Z2T3_9BACT|nr:hypothetical protein CA13_27080 [Planctomycetes bacterium CA13]